MTQPAVRINRSQLADVRRALSEIQGAAPRVISRALNRTFTGVRTDITQEAGKEITAKASTIRDTVKITNATIAKPSGLVASVGKPLPLISFSARQTKKGVSVQVRKNKARTVLPSTWIGTMKTGYKGVFRREYREQSGAGKRASRPGMKYGRLPKKYRFKIVQKFGLRVPDIVGNEPVMVRILAKASARLQERLKHETEYELSRLK